MTARVRDNGTRRRICTHDQLRQAQAGAATPDLAGDTLVQFLFFVVKAQTAGNAHGVGEIVGQLGKGRVGVRILVETGGLGRRIRQGDQGPDGYRA